MFRYIIAMAYDKHKIENILVGISGELTYHLIKLYLFNNSVYAAHWRNEVYSFLNNIPKFKHNKKLPSAKFIYENISGYLDECEDIMHVILEEYNSFTPCRFDSKELYRCIDRYFLWISDYLSQHVAVTSHEVYTQLKKLGL